MLMEILTLSNVTNLFQISTRFIANSSSCTTAEMAEISKLLMYYLTAVKKHVIKHCKKYIKDPVRLYFGLLNAGLNIK